MNEEQDEKYQITLKGLISVVVSKLQTEIIINEIQNYMTRHRFNAIVYDPTKDCYLEFVQAHTVEEKQ